MKIIKDITTGLGELRLNGYFRTSVSKPVWQDPNAEQTSDGPENVNLNQVLTSNLTKQADKIMIRTVIQPVKIQHVIIHNTRREDEAGLNSREGEQGQLDAGGTGELPLFAAAWFHIQEAWPFYDYRSLLYSAEQCDECRKHVTKEQVKTQTFLLLLGLTYK